MKLRTANFAEVSLKHITQKDSEILAVFASYSDGASAPLSVCEYECGFYIIVPPGDHWPTAKGRLEVYNASNALINIVNLCVEQKIPLLNLDRDLEDTDGLEWFDW